MIAELRSAKTSKLKRRETLLLDHDDTLVSSYRELKR